MGKLLHGSFKGAEEWCAVHSGNAQVVTWAVEGNEAALRGLAESTLEDALSALATCKSGHCDNHEREYEARWLLDKVLCEVLEEAQLREEESERAGCPRCSGVCGACTPGAGGG